MSRWRDGWEDVRARLATPLEALLGALSFSSYAIGGTLEESPVGNVLVLAGLASGMLLLAHAALSETIKRDWRKVILTGALLLAAAIAVRIDSVVVPVDPVSKDRTPANHFYFKGCCPVDGTPHHPPASSPDNAGPGNPHQRDESDADSPASPGKAAPHRSEVTGGTPGPASAREGELEISQYPPLLVDPPESPPAEEVEPETVVASGGGGELAPDAASPNEAVPTAVPTEALPPQTEAPDESGDAADP